MNVSRYMPQFKSGYFLNNYGSGQKGIFAIHGVPIFQFTDNYFSKNGDSYSEILDKAGGNFKQIQQYRYNSTIPKTMKAFILFDYVYCPHIKNLTVDGGFKYTLSYNKY